MQCSTKGSCAPRPRLAPEASGPADGLAALDAIEADAAGNYQPYWAVRAHVLSRMGRERDALTAVDHAIALTADPAITQFLSARRAQVHSSAASPRLGQ